MTAIRLVAFFNEEASDPSQPPLTLDWSEPEPAGSDSLHRRVRWPPKSQRHETSLGPRLAAVESRVVPRQRDGQSFREKEVLIRIVRGFGNKEIADSLNVSVRTVESHRERIMGKLGIHSVAGRTRFALAKGLITLQDAVAR